LHFEIISHNYSARQDLTKFPFLTKLFLLIYSGKGKKKSWWYAGILGLKSKLWIL